MTLVIILVTIFIKNISKIIQRYFIETGTPLIDHEKTTKAVITSMGHRKFILNHSKISMNPK